MARSTIVYLHTVQARRPAGALFVANRLLRRSRYRIETLTNWLPGGRHARDVLPGHVHLVFKLPLPPRWVPGRAIWLAGRAVANLALGALAGLRGGVLGRRRKAKVILCAADDGFAVVAGLLAARLARGHLVIWVFDLWEENAYDWPHRWLAARLERRVWRRSAAVLVHAPEIARVYEEKHGIACHVLPTPADLDLELRRRTAPAHAGAPAREAPAPGAAAREVLIAGAIYWAQEEAVRRLARVCARMDDVRLTVVGSPDLLKLDGMPIDHIEPAIPADEVLQRLRCADVLFLGLSFGTRNPVLIRTATPARLPEYMASGTPILIHAPRDSHVAGYARREGFAAVVDVPDDDELHRGLRTVLDDPELARRRAARAVELARTRHDAARVAKELERILERAERAAR